MSSLIFKKKNKFEAQKVNNGVLIVFLIVSLLFIFSIAYSSINNKLINMSARQTQQPPH